MAINFEENFELGTLGDFNSETDTDGGLNIRNYKAIARDGGTPNLNAMPYRGAYALEADLAVISSDGYLQEDDGFDMALEDTDHIRFYFYVTSDLTMATTERFTLFVLQSAGPANEVTVSIRDTAGLKTIIADETGATAGRPSELSLGVWHCVELTAHLDAGGGNDGTLDFFLDGVQVGAQITGLDQAAIIQARLGAMDVDAGTTKGRVYFSEIINHDDTAADVQGGGRVYPENERWLNPRTFTKSGHFFVGPGHLDYIALASASADNVIRCFDTDEGDVTPARSWVLELDPDAHTSINTPIWFKRGCYVQLSGSVPRVTAKWVENSEVPGVFGPIALSDAALRSLAR